MFYLPKAFKIICENAGQHVTNLSSTANSNHVKVTVVGAAGKIGRALALMLKQSILIDELSLYDLKNTAGIAAELNCIDTTCKVTGLWGRNRLEDALKDSNLVVSLASSHKEVSSSSNWYPNAKIIDEIVDKMRLCAPTAWLAIGTSPINSTVPLACRLLKKKGIYNPNGVFGVTTLDIVRANTFAAQVLNVDPESILVPVIGGASKKTAVPILSHMKPAFYIPDDEAKKIATDVQCARDALQSSETPLASAFAFARFIVSLAKALKGYKNVVETAYVPSDEHPDVEYLATPLLLKEDGVAKNLGVPELTEAEYEMLDSAVDQLDRDVRAGEKMARAM
ncbi:unnamed protein product [Phyllotreta striolata]|uniref:Malate dehydrogenase, mitochondrial n=1 Tax=Phyllotreta striolata TaxID=444603 RepID=A0A9N9TUE7_PHYSR|nr:unnamed protein product [Phyllotreta striolata]